MSEREDDAPLTTPPSAAGPRPEARSDDARDGAVPPEGGRSLGAPVPTGVHLRTVSSVGTFVLLLGFALYLTRGLVLPVVLALLLKFLLTPLVRGLRRLHVPEIAGSALVVVALVSLLGVGVWRLTEPTKRWMTEAPQTLEQLEEALRDIKEPVEQLGEATAQVEEMTSVENRRARTGPEVTVRRAPLSDTLLSTTTEVLGGFVVLVILLFFLLAAGDAFLRKLVELMPRLESKKEAVHVFRDLERDLSRYLLTVTLINGGLGALVATAMHLLGMPNPILWGVMAGLFNFIPYLGAIVSATVLTLVAVTTFGDDATRILAVPGVFLLLSAIEGQLLTPIVLGRRLTLNPVAIFLGVLFWGWLWSIPGALLAVPILVALKIVTAHAPPLRPLGEFLGAYSEDRGPLEA